MRLHWENALNRVAATAAATLRDGDKSKNESANNQKEGNPEHDTGDQVEGLLLSISGRTKIKLSNFTLTLFIFDNINSIISP